MTANQIKYNEYLENARHNRVSERHEHRQVGAQELQAQASHMQALTAQATQEEQARHNVANENYNWWQGFNSLIESKRHNQESERISQYSADTDRQIREGELAVKRETLADRQRQTDIAQQDAETRMFSALTSRQQIGLGYAQLAETARHSQAVEAETARANRAAELNRFGTLTTQRSYNDRSLRVQEEKLKIEDTSARAAMLRAYGSYTSGQASLSHARAAQQQADTAESRRKQDMWLGIWGNVNKSVELFGRSSDDE